MKLLFAQNVVVPEMFLEKRWWQTDKRFLRHRLRGNDSLSLIEITIGTA